MGLISFMQSAGTKLKSMVGLGPDAPAEPTAEEIATTNAAIVSELIASIGTHGIHVQNLGVLFENATATISGTVQAQADKEKAVLIVGNTEGVGTVDDQIEVKEPAPPSYYRTVKSGDSLSKISLEVYGAIHLYDTIFNANKPMLKHPDEIYPGQLLRIPPVAAPIHTVAKGETLGSIAKHWYGKAGRYTDIFEANTNILSNPNVVEVGQALRIPLSPVVPSLQLKA
jgi:nucleoid-associated protein YgaU